MENNIVQNTYIKLVRALQNIRYIARGVSLDLNWLLLALGTVKYLGNPLGYIPDIIGGLYIVSLLPVSVSVISLWSSILIF